MSQQQQPKVRKVRGFDENQPSFMCSQRGREPGETDHLSELKGEQSPEAPTDSNSKRTHIHTHTSFVPPLCVILH